MPLEGALGRIVDRLRTDRRDEALDMGSIPFEHKPPFNHPEIFAQVRSELNRRLFRTPEAQISNDISQVAAIALPLLDRDLLDTSTMLGRPDLRALYGNARQILKSTLRDASIEITSTMTDKTFKHGDRKKAVSLMDITVHALLRDAQSQLRGEHSQRDFDTQSYLQDALETLADAKKLKAETIVQRLNVARFGKRVSVKADDPRAIQLARTAVATGTLATVLAACDSTGAVPPIPTRVIISDPGSGGSTDSSDTADGIVEFPIPTESDTEPLPSRIEGATGGLVVDSVPINEFLAQMEVDGRKVPVVYEPYVSILRIKGNDGKQFDIIRHPEVVKDVYGQDIVVPRMFIKVNGQWKDLTATLKAMPLNVNGSTGQEVLHYVWRLPDLPVTPAPMEEFTGQALLWYPELSAIGFDASKFDMAFWPPFETGARDTAYDVIPDDRERVANGLAAPVRLTESPTQPPPLPTDTPPPPPTNPPLPTEPPPPTATLETVFNSFYTSSQGTKDYDSKLHWGGNWFYRHEDPEVGSISFNSDPTFGPVIHYQIAENISRNPFWLQLDEAGPPISPPWKITIPVRFSEDYLGVNILSVFNDTPHHHNSEDDGLFSIAATVDIESDGRPFLLIHRAYGKYGTEKRIFSDTVLTPNNWHVIELVMNTEGRVSLIIDGTLIGSEKINEISGEILPDKGMAIRSIHGGAHGESISGGAWVENGKTEISGN